MNDREKWRERVKDIALAARHDDDDDNSFNALSVAWILKFIALEI